MTTPSAPRFGARLGRWAARGCPALLLALLTSMVPGATTAAGATPGSAAGASAGAAASAAAGAATGANAGAHPDANAGAAAGHRVSYAAAPGIQASAVTATGPEAGHEAAGPEGARGGPAAGVVPISTGTDALPYPELLPAHTDDAGVSISLVSLTPAVARPGSDVTVVVRLTDTRHEAGTVSTRLLVGPSIITRADLDRPLTGQTHLAPATNPVTAALARGSSTLVTVVIRADSVPMPGPYGVLPLIVEASRGGPASRLATYLPFEVRKEYEPLAISFAIPLTADPEPALYSSDAATRLGAWASTVGPGSRLERILTGVGDAPVTFAVDPVVLGPARSPLPALEGSAAGTSTPPGAPTASGTTQPTATGTAPGGTATTPPAATTPDPAAATPDPRAAFAARVAARTSGRPVWSLAPEDPDLSALAEAGVTLPPGLLAADPSLRTRLREAGSVTPVAWPSGAGLGKPARDAITSASSPAAWVLPLSATGERGETGTAARRFGDGSPILAYDDQLARVLADTGSPGQGAALAQRFLAETVTILQEYPSRTRALLVAAPRWFTPDPTALRTVLAAASDAPWLMPSTTESLLIAAQDAGAPTAPDPTRPEGSGSAWPPSGSDPAPSPGGASGDGAPSTSGATSRATATGDPLTRAASPLSVNGGRPIDVVVTELARLADLRTVLPAQSALVEAPAGAGRALLSTRWRGQDQAWQAVQDQAQKQALLLFGGVEVRSSQVNFFSDTGTLQVTIINNLDVDLRDVRLVLEPESRPSRLRVSPDPVVLTIRAKSRATVKVEVEAVAAGRARVWAELSTPAGTRLGLDRTWIDVRVQPTNGWLVLALGALAGGVFLVGLIRNIRKRAPRFTAEELKEIDLA